MSKAAQKKSASLLCFGEVTFDQLWVLDTLPRGKGDCHILLEQGAPGGCALNSACVLKSLGCDVTLAGNFVGNDARGRSIIEYLKNAEIDSRIVAKDKIQTPFCQVLVEKDTGEREFILDHQDIQKWDESCVGSLVEECRSGNFSHVFVQPYLRELSKYFLNQIQDLPIWIFSQDLNLDSEFILKIDALQLSLGDEIAFEMNAIQKFADPYWKGRLTELFLTAGSRGVAYIKKGNAPQLFKAIPVKGIKDTTGCGDAFRAGVMAGLSKDNSVGGAIFLGQNLGAHKASIYGSHFLNANTITS